MASITFEQFFRSIVQQESGGNYKAIGPQTRYGRAYGRYQVLESNIPSWTRQYYGKSVSTQTFLNSPKIQDIVARGRLKMYWDKYGIRGAAAAWYSGDPSLHMSTKPQQGGPSIKQYVDEVVERAGGLPATGGGDSGGGGSGGGGTPRLDPKELAESYGFASAFLNSVPELKKLFEQAVANGWSKDMFVAKLRDTKWFKSMSADQRKRALELSSDPATAKEKYNEAYVRVRQLANRLGIRENEFTLKKIAEAAQKIVWQGWDDSQLRYFLGQYVYFGENQQQGEGGEVWDQLHQYAYQMGVEMSGDWYADVARKVVRGLGTVQDYKNIIMQRAKAQLPQWSKQIEAGQTVTDLAQPYLQTMAQILELAPGSVNLFDPTIKKALSYTDPKSLEKGAKPLWQFENELRNDPRWKKTKNAQDSLLQIGHKVLVDMGLAF